MSTAILRGEEPSVFRYGFLSSRTSEAIKEYLDSGKLSESSRDVLKDADSLLSDILLAQGLFGEKNQFGGQTERTLEAFSCALEVIVKHRDDFGINDIKGLAELFETLHQTLGGLAVATTDAQISPQDIDKTRMFFKRFSKLMLAQLSVPQEGESSRVCKLQ